MSSSTEIARLTEIARGILDGDSSCHDWDHTLRVLRTAMRLAEGAAADPAVITAAAILHDIGRPQETADRGKSDHAAIGARMALAILADEEIGDEPFRRHVADCIRTHRYRSRTAEAPATIEARIIYDADKLDSLGAIGLARSFHFAGRSGARVHNTAGEALSGLPYGREDSAYREYLVKLRELPARMLTAAGRAEASRRVAFMAAFFDELNQECDNT